MQLSEPLVSITRFKFLPVCHYIGNNYLYYLKQQHFSYLGYPPWNPFPFFTDGLFISLWMFYEKFRCLANHCKFTYKTKCAVRQ